MLHTVKNIIAVESQKLTLEFNTGEIFVVDLKDKLNEWTSGTVSKWSELLDKENFAKVKLNKDFGSVEWENGLDLCPDVLYDLCKNSKKKKAA